MIGKDLPIEYVVESQSLHGTQGAYKPQLDWKMTSCTSKYLSWQHPGSHNSFADFKWASCRCPYWVWCWERHKEGIEEFQGVHVFSWTPVLNLLPAQNLGFRVSNSRKHAWGTLLNFSYQIANCQCLNPSSLKLLEEPFDHNFRTFAYSPCLLQNN